MFSLISCEEALLLFFPPLATKVCRVSVVTFLQHLNSSRWCGFTLVLFETIANKSVQFPTRIQIEPKKLFNSRNNQKHRVGSKFFEVFFISCLTWRSRQFCPSAVSGTLHSGDLICDSITGRELCQNEWSSVWFTLRIKQRSPMWSFSQQTKKKKIGDFSFSFLKSHSEAFSPSHIERLTLQLFSCIYFTSRTPRLQIGTTNHKKTPHKLKTL